MPIPQFFLVLAVVGGSSTALATSAPRFDTVFWEHWGDGQAEVAGYDLVYSRYGEKRTGVAVSIFVTETFSDSSRVKADPGMHPADDEYPVLKLNLVQDFSTGIYDYNMMTSSFIQLAKRNRRAAGAATKVSFSAQEWCGHAYSQILFDSERVRLASHSYFDGEGDEQKTLPYPQDGFASDTLMFWARGLAGPVLKPGESLSVPFLTSLERTRLDHRPLQWTTATLTRTAGTRQMTVPAGKFEVETFTAQVVNGLLYTFSVEKNFPHRVVSWKTSRGDRGELRGVKRLKYWQLNGPGGQKVLAELGLKPRAAQMP